MSVLGAPGRFVRRDDLVSNPRRFAQAVPERFVPGETDQQGDDNDFEEEAHGRLGFVVTAALSVQPVPLALLVGVIDVPGK